MITGSKLLLIRYGVVNLCQGKFVHDTEDKGPPARSWVWRAPRLLVIYLKIYWYWTGCQVLGGSTFETRFHLWSVWGAAISIWGGGVELKGGWMGKGMSGWRIFINKCKWQICSRKPISAKKLNAKKKQMATPPKELGDWMDFEAFLIYLKWRVGVT